jgi:hypothetical protein
MKYFLLFCTTLILAGCYWTNPGGGYVPEPPMSQQKVWGSKPVYEATSAAKQIGYISSKQPIGQAGNIYAKGTFIFQVDVGRGLHVIDNSVPSKADRIGFIKVNGCTQISIKGNYLYTNSLSDLVTLDISNPLQLKEVSRIPDAFPEFRYNYPLAQPDSAGFFQCPRYDSVVVGWVKDSIYTSCYKN